MFIENSRDWVCREIGILQGKLQLSLDCERIHGQHLIAEPKRVKMQERIDELTAALQKKTSKVG